MPGASGGRCLCLQYFESCPPGVPIEGLVGSNGFALLYVGISPKRPSAVGKVTVVLCSGLSWLGLSLPGLVQSHGEWWLRQKQRIPISPKPIDELPFFSSQFRLHPFGYPFANLGRPQLRKKSSILLARESGSIPSPLVQRIR